MIGVGTTIFLVRPEVFPSGTTYLLDTYSATAAYSLRQLKTGVTNVVRVRRSSDNAESDFTATEITDGTLTTWTGANDGFVTTWYDQSGNGNNVTQSTAGSQPQIVYSGSIITLTGTSLPTIWWSLGGIQRLSRTALTEMNNGNDFSIFSVAKGVNGTVHSILSTENTVSPSRFTQLTGQAASGALAQVHNGTVGANVTIGSNLSTAAYQYSTIVDGTAQSVDCYYNGNGAYTNTWTGSYANNILQVGLDRDVLWEINDIAELIIFGSDESANRTSIESDINTYYSIY